MKIGLYQNCCINDSFLSFLDKSRNFDGIEVKYDSLKSTLTKDLNIKAIRESLDVFDVRIIDFFSLENFSLCSDREFQRKIIPTFRKMLQYCYNLETYLVSVTPSYESRSIPQWRINRKTTKRLKKIGRIAKKEDVKIGLEIKFLPESSIKTLENAKEVISPLYSEENIGYIIDTFHFGKSKIALDDLLDIKRLIFLFRLSDLSEDSEENLLNLRETERKIPGEGIFNFRRLLNMQQRLKYSNIYSIAPPQDTDVEELYLKLKNQVFMQY